MSARIALPSTGSSGPGIALPAQTRLDAYEVEALVAQGSFALVYRAVHPATQQVVAIEEYFPEAIALRHAAHRVTPRSPSCSERFEVGRRAFLDEARSLARFEHPSLVRVLGLFEGNGTAYRVMRFTPGPTLLAHRLALGRMPAVEDFRRWVDGLLGALATLHQAGCVHGAVSPANILLRPGERPLLLGFDAVRSVLAPIRRLGPVQPIDGSPVPPAGRVPCERLAATAAADLRALASTLRYCIEGGAPAAESLAEAWQREGGPVPIPQDIVRLLRAIDACSSDDPDGWPRSVAEFRRWLGDASATGPLRVVNGAGAPDLAFSGSTPELDLGPNSAGDTLRDLPAEPMAGDDPGAARDPPADIEPLFRDEPGVGRVAEAEAEAEAVSACEVEADVGIDAGPVAVVDEAPQLAAAFSAPSPPLAEVPGTSAPPDSNPAASGTNDFARPPLDEDRTARVPAPVSTTDGAAANRTVWPRRTAAALAVAASVVLAAGLAAWGDRQVEPPLRQHALPTETHVVAALRAEPTESVPAPAVVPAPIPVSMATHDAGSPPAAGMPARAEAQPALAPPKQPPSAPVAKTPAAPRKIVVAAAKTKSPNEACEGRKGFALYRCVQLQCAKPASADHADCASLR